MPLIILEGVDGAGKTTVADLIAAKYSELGYSVCYLHYSQLKRDPFDEYTEPFLYFAENTLVLVDRSYQSELIYAPLYRGASAINLKLLGELETLYLGTGAVFAHVTAELDAVYDRLSDRGEDYLRTSDVEAVHSAYTDFFEETIVPTAVVDTTSTHTRTQGLEELYALVAR